MVTDGGIDQHTDEAQQQNEEAALSIRRRTRAAEIAAKPEELEKQGEVRKRNQDREADLLKAMDGADEKQNKGDVIRSPLPLFQLRREAEEKQRHRALYHPAHLGRHADGDLRRGLMEKA